MLSQPSTACLQTPAATKHVIATPPAIARPDMDSPLRDTSVLHKTDSFCSRFGPATRTAMHGMLTRNQIMTQGRAAGWGIRKPQTVVLRMPSAAISKQAVADKRGIVRAQRQNSTPPLHTYRAASGATGSWNLNSKFQGQNRYRN